MTSTSSFGSGRRATSPSAPPAKPLPTSPPATRAPSPAVAMGNDWAGYGIAPQHSPASLPATPTPSQTAGPFFSIGLGWLGEAGETLCAPNAPGSLRLTGVVRDGLGDPVPDALLELWHPDVGWGRSLTDAAGTYQFVVAAVPYYAVSVFGRGLLQRLVTRIYLPPLSDDEFLASVHPQRRDTLVATAVDGGIRHDIVLQGDRETVFVVW